MNKKMLCAIASLFFFMAMPSLAETPPPLSAPGGIYHPVSTRSPEVQRLFNLGLVNIYAFNHDEAIRIFKEALKIEPDFAMAYWGIALSLGPNINLPADPPRQKAAYDAIQKALAFSGKLPEQERRYIDAVAARYTGKPDEDLKKLAKDYSDAMKELSAKYPDDPDAATLYAESLMDLHPWALWKPDGVPEEGTLELVAVLEGVMRRHPGHIGANHYYIHAVEASPHPEWALPSAQRLQAMQLPQGHLVHMPAHIYMRTGDYTSASESNQAAASADLAFLKSSGASGIYPMLYYSHNLHFLAVSRAMEGRYGDALDAAQKAARHVTPHVKEQPEFEFFVPTPTLILARFHKWQEILRLPQPSPQMPVAALAWHFARGLAYAATGDLAKARQERRAFLQSAGKIPPETLIDLNSAKNVNKVAEYYLDGRIALARGDLSAAEDLLRKGVAAEDALRYTEPPTWYLPVREALGGVLLKKKDYREAERVFREELVKNPRSGRALFGLWQSLKGEGKTYQAELVQREYQEAWRTADSNLDLESL